MHAEMKKKILLYIFQYEWNTYNCSRETATLYHKSLIFQRHSHIIYAAAKLSFEDTKLYWRGVGSGNFFKKWCIFVHSSVFFSTNFVSFFLRHYIPLFSWCSMPHLQKVLVRQMPHLPHPCLCPCV